MVESESSVEREMKDVLSTERWNTLRIIDRPASEVELVPSQPDVEETPEAKVIRQEVWLGALHSKQILLQATNPQLLYSAFFDKESDNYALYVTDPDGGGEIRRIMWDGDTLAVRQENLVNKQNKLQIPVFPIKYSQQVACQNPLYAATFRNRNEPVPNTGLGISILMETSDGFIPLNRRGLETPVYPGMLYPPGGGPLPGQTSTSAIVSEVVEEVGLHPDKDFDPANIKILALVQDNHFMGSDHAKPELVAHLQLDRKFRYLMDSQYQEIVKKHKEADVWGLVPFPNYLPTYGRYLIYTGREMCPPTEAGLANLLWEKFFEENPQTARRRMEKVMGEMRSFERETFQPPVRKLSDNIG